MFCMLKLTRALELILFLILMFSLLNIPTAEECQFFLRSIAWKQEKQAYIPKSNNSHDEY